jgi:hypothetical protein
VYVSPEPDKSIQVFVARRELIEAVKRTYRRVLEALSEDVFPFYFNLARAGYDFDRILSSPTVSPYAALTEDGGLKQAITKWAIQFNADCPWLKDDVLQALRGWYVAPEYRESLRWNVFHSSLSSGATGEPFEFSYGRWEAEQLTWTKYSDSLRAEFEEKLSKYKEETRKLAISRGLVPARRQYSPDNFDWFVLYQFKGQSPTEIAKPKKRDGENLASTVKKGIETAAQLIVWSGLRKTKI